MRKTIKKLKDSNVVISSLERPIYSTTSTNISCDANGPNCDNDINEDDFYESGWTEVEGQYNNYDWHLCPECQRSNCMQCGSDKTQSGQCEKKSCDNHKFCSECKEPYFQNMYGEDYCVNLDCLKNESSSTKTSSRSYWRQCDGPPECTSEGWDPEYDLQPRGWHTTDHDRNGKKTTDYCENCWENEICHECEQALDKNGVCQNSNRGFQCNKYQKCSDCGSNVNEFGNCMYDAGYSCDYAFQCKHCDEKLELNGICNNKDCSAFNNPYSQILFPKEAHYTYVDDPNYPDEPDSIINCDYPGCNAHYNTENPVSPFHMHFGYNIHNDEVHYCPYDYDNNICDNCLMPNDVYGRCSEKKCSKYNRCPDCGSTKDYCTSCGGSTKDYCTSCGKHNNNYSSCVNPHCVDFKNPYQDILFPDKK